LAFSLNTGGRAETYAEAVTSCSSLFATRLARSVRWRCCFDHERQGNRGSLRQRADIPCERKTPISRNVPADTGPEPHGEYPPVPFTKVRQESHLSATPCVVVQSVRVKEITNRVSGHSPCRFGHNLGTNENYFRILLIQKPHILVRRGGLEPPRDCSR
jgi:hypothetical protein